MRVPRVLVLVLAVAAAWACGPAAVDPTSEAWPTRVAAPGVLGYASIPLGEGALEAALEELLGRTLDEDEFALLAAPQRRRNQVMKLRKDLKPRTSQKAP